MILKIHHFKIFLVHCTFTCGVQVIYIWCLRQMEIVCNDGPLCVPPNSALGDDTLVACNGPMGSLYTRNQQMLQVRA